MRWSLAVALTLGMLAACGGSASDPTPPATEMATPVPTPSPTRTPAPTVTATPTPPLTPSGDPATAEALAASAAFFLYEARANETPEELAGSLGPAGLSGGELRMLNGLADAPLAEGQPVAIPNAYAGGQLVPAAALEALLGIDRKRPGLRLLRPGTNLVDGLLGRLALHRVRLSRPDSPGGTGYLLIFAQTDRPPLKGGVLDPDARAAGASFAIAGGSLAGVLEGENTLSFERDGARYTVQALDRAGLRADQIATLLDEGPER